MIYRVGRRRSLSAGAALVRAFLVLAAALACAARSRAADGPGERPRAADRDIVLERPIEHRYLLFPVKTGAPKRRVALAIEGETVREFEIELSDEPTWWVHLDVEAWRGRQASLRVHRIEKWAHVLNRVKQSDTIWSPETVDREPPRGQLHFSPRRGWNNDPNGLVFAHGEYHLYFQHNPYGWGWGNMHWGHAVSPDLVHWKELPIAVYPRQFGDWAFSGSAVVDRGNTSGWKKGENDLLVAAYTSTGRGECILYSRDRGRSWTEFDGNPVVKHQGRDPRLLWHAPTKRWVMAVYDESEKKRWIAFYTSPDLKTWTYQSRVEGFYECPDLFELPVNGDPNQRQWVLTAASAEYMVGEFDGAVFRSRTPKLPGHRGRGYYAAQTFSDVPRGRVVRVGWFQTETPGVPFNQSMSLPSELALIETRDGPRLSWRPVEELKTLRAREVWKLSGEFAPSDRPIANAQSELVEIRAEFAPAGAGLGVLALKLRGTEIVYDASAVGRELRVGDIEAAAPLRDGKQRLIVYVDRTGLEVFASDGLTYVPCPRNLAPTDLSLEARVREGALQIDSLKAFALRGIWNVDGH